MIYHSGLGQRGMTLIGAMVGLVVSMLIVLTLMSAYRSVVRLTMESNADARQSGDLAAAFLFTHLNLSDAGRSLVNPTPTRADDLLLCENGELVGETLTGCDPGVSGNGSGNAIFWRWGDPDDPDAFFCAGLLASARGQLDYLTQEEEGDCEGPGWPLDDWTALTLIHPTPINPTGEYPEIDFSVVAGPCWPLGAAASLVVQGRFAVTISSTHVGSSTDLHSRPCS